ncbi:ankyrin repeat-containing domain protein [Xylariaceae sp. FL0804]|nr:ankyrin repeat-containing domain protein [Xylariaceae sp. FL0804]
MQLQQVRRHGTGAIRVIKRVVAILQQFGPVIDTAVSFDPVHAALPWAAVRAVLVLLNSNEELKSKLLAGIAMVSSLLAQCETCHQLYMAPEPKLRPPETALSELKDSIVRAYKKSQQFLCFAIRQRSGKGARVTAPFKLGDVNNYRDELSEHEKQLSCDAERCGQLCALSTRSNVQKLQKLFEDFPRVFQDQIDLVLKRLDNVDRIRVLNWISTVPIGEHHGEIRMNITPDTCQWLLKRQCFREWDEASSSTILWLQGSPGAGKTYLTSEVINHKKTELEESPDEEGFAYFYCNRNEEQRRKQLSVLQSYVCQLSTTKRNPECIRKELEEIYTASQAAKSDLGYEQCKKQLLESVKLYSRSTLVLDALDECEETSRAQILDVIEYLISQTKNVVKVFISSRPELDILSRFRKKGTPNVEIQATDNDEDIQKFVRQKIETHKHWEMMSPILKDEIVNVLFTKSQGMFQWAYLQINELRGCITEQDIREQLKVLPRDLETAYHDIYKRISERQSQKALADNAFRWVACACKPLWRGQLLFAIRLGSANDRLDLSEAINEDQLLDICRGLLVLDSQTHDWRFSHLSVTEYFEKNHWSLLKAHEHAGIVCLKLLINLSQMSSFWSRSVLKLPINPSEMEAYYSSWNVEDDYIGKMALEALKHVEHVSRHQQQPVANVLTGLLKTFLGSPNNSSPHYHAWYNMAAHTIHNNLWMSRQVPLFAMCRFSLYKILPDWWNADAAVSVTNKYGLNLLHVAARHGTPEICENLIDRGIDLLVTRGAHVNMWIYHGTYRSALQAATSQGHFHIARLLVQFGARDHVQSGDYCDSALTKAVERREFDIAEFLVREAEADVNMQAPSGSKFGNVLQQAARQGSLDFVKFLYGSAVAVAAHVGKLDIIKFLMDEAGVDANQQLQHGVYGSALTAAASGAKLEVTKFLVNEAGVDANQQLQYGEFGSALAAAAWRGELEVIKFLVNEAGVNANQQLQHGVYGSALAAAAWWLEATKFLVYEAGVDANQQLQHGWYGSALAAAARLGGLEVIKFLVNEAGVDAKQQLQYGEYGSALAAAARAGALHVTKFLVNEAGVDANQQLQYGEYGSALTAAACAGELEVTKFLVNEAGVDANQQLQHGLYGSPLAAAATAVAAVADVAAPYQRDVADPEPCLTFLIEAGAEVNQQIRHGVCGTALAAAAYWGRPKMVGLLIKAGAEVNLKIENGPFRTALQASESESPEEQRTKQVLRINAQRGSWIGGTRSFPTSPRALLLLLLLLDVDLADDDDDVCATCVRRGAARRGRGLASPPTKPAWRWDAGIDAGVAAMALREEREREREQD